MMKYNCIWHKYVRISDMFVVSITSTRDKGNSEDLWARTTTYYYRIKFILSFYFKTKVRNNLEWRNMSDYFLKNSPTITEQRLKEVLHIDNINAILSLSFYSYDIGFCGFFLNPHQKLWRHKRLSNLRISNKGF